MHCKRSNGRNESTLKNSVGKQAFPLDNLEIERGRENAALSPQVFSAVFHAGGRRHSFFNNCETGGRRTPSEFAAFQARRQRELWKLLGDLPRERPPRVLKIVKTEKHRGFTLERLILDLNGIEPVPALLLIPNRRPPKGPGLLYIHAHGGTYGLGSEELLEGREILPAYAPVCAGKGLVTLAIDSWCFGKRNHTPNGDQEELDTFKLLLWRGQILWGMMLFDEFQALGFLRGRPEVDSKRIGALDAGHLAGYISDQRWMTGTALLSRIVSQSLNFPKG